MKSHRIACKNTWLSLGVVALCALLAVSSDVPPARAADPIALAIGTSRDPNNGGLLMVAKDMNYFRDSGLNVTLKYFPSGGDLVNAVASQALFIGSGGSVPTTTLRAGGYNAVILAQQADISDAQQIVAQKDVVNPKDLEGKKIGALFGTVSEMLVNSMIQHYHLQRDKITLVNLGPPDQITALLRGDIAAAALWTPWSSQAIKGGAHLLVSGLHSYVPGHSGAINLVGDHSLLFASKDWVDKNPAIVTAVLKSLLQAQRFVASDPAKAAEIIGRELQVPQAEMQSMMTHDRFSMAIDAKLVRDMNNLASFLYSNGSLKTPVKAADWIDTGPLRSIAPNMVKWHS